MNSMLLSFLPILFGFFVTQCGSNNVMPSFDATCMVTVTERSPFDVIGGIIGLPGKMGGDFHEKVGTSVGKGMMAELLSSWQGIAFMVFLGIIVFLLLALVLVLILRRGGGHKH